MSDLIAQLTASPDADNIQLQSAQLMYTSVMEKLNAVDELLDSTTDAKTAGKRALRNEMVKKFESDWQPIAKQVSDFLSQLSDPEQKFGVFYALVRALNETFDKPADEYLAAKVDENKTDPNAPKPEQLTDDQIRQLSEQRSLLYKNAKQTRELALLFGGTEETFPLPKKRTGTRGKRGMRAITMYDWQINGAPLSGENNNLLYVSKTYGYEKAADLRKAIQDALELKDLKDPPAEITFQLPNKDILFGKRDITATPEASENGDDEDDDDDDEDDD